MEILWPVITGTLFALIMLYERVFLTFAPKILGAMKLREVWSSRLFASLGFWKRFCFLSSCVFRNGDGRDGKGKMGKWGRKGLLDLRVSIGNKTLKIPHSWVSPSDFYFLAKQVEQR